MLWWAIWIARSVHIDLILFPMFPVSAEVGIESVNHHSRDLGRGPLLTTCCALRYIEDLELRIASMEGLIKRVSQEYQRSPQHAGIDPPQHVPDQDLSDLLDAATGAPSRPNLRPPNDPALPSRSLPPSGRRVDVHRFRGIQDFEVSLTTDTAQGERGEYHGPASVYGLVESAIEFHDGMRCDPMPFQERFPNRRREFWEVQYVSLFMALCHPRRYADWP